MPSGRARSQQANLYSISSPRNEVYFVSSIDRVVLLQPGCQIGHSAQVFVNFEMGNCIEAGVLFLTRGELGLIPF